MANSTLVPEFFLEVFAETWELRILLTVLFLLMYLGSLLGNLIIIIATTVDQTLNTPMYFFLRNLSILDMCYISVTVPNACINSLTDHRNISVAGCAAQIFSFLFCALVETLSFSWPRIVMWPFQTSPLSCDHEPLVLCSDDTGFPTYLSYPCKCAHFQNFPVVLLSL